MGDMNKWNSYDPLSLKDREVCKYDWCGCKNRRNF